MFQDLKIDSDMLDANENYFVSTYLSDFNYRHQLTRVIQFVCNPVAIPRTIKHNRMQFNA